ncbi:hypothetical protein V7S56_31760 [Chitinophaga sp. CCNWLY40]
MHTKNTWKPGEKKHRIRVYIFGDTSNSFADNPIGNDLYDEKSTGVKK